MSDVTCRVCGEPWDAYHIRNDAPAWVAPLFFAGAGCESCEGVAPEGRDADATAYKSDAGLVLGGAIDADPLEVRPALMGAGVPAWKRPVDAIAWTCDGGCGLKVVRDADWKEGQEFACYFRGIPSFQIARELGLSYSSDTFPSLSDAVETISYDGAACRCCRYPCGDCERLISDDCESYSDPRDPYHAPRLCADCYSSAEYENAVNGFDSSELARSLKLSRQGRGWFAARVTFEDVPSDLYEISSEGLHYTPPRTREGTASYVREIRRAVRRRIQGQSK